MSLRDNPNIVNDVSDIRRDLDELALSVRSDGSVTTNMLADESVTADKIDWGSMYAYIKYAGAVFTTDSTTLTDKMSITGVPKGTYLIRANTNWFNNNGGANGECNMRLAKVDGGTATYSDTSTILIPPVEWVGMQNVFETIWTIDNDDATVKVQTSVNWPTRGTYYCRATSYLMLIRVGTLHP